MEQKINNTSNKYEKKIITIPNILSFFRLCLIPVIVWLYGVDHNYVCAGYILILSGMTDMVDGYIARRFHMVSNLGKILDPIADKLTQGIMLVCLLLRFRFMIVPFALLIAKEIYMSVSGILIIQRTGIVCGAEWHGKVATCLLYGMMILHVFWYEITPVVSSLFIIACTLMIVISLGLYGVRNMRILKQANEHRK